jgi:hypothetical protein
MHPAVPLVATFGGLALLLVGVGVLWWIGNSQRRQADAAEQQADQHRWMLAAEYPEYRHQAVTRVMSGAARGGGR